MDGYNLYYGENSGNYDTMIDAGTNLTATVTNLLSGTNYFFAVTAYSLDGRESVPSNEVQATP